MKLSIDLDNYFFSSVLWRVGCATRRVSGL